MLALSLWCPYRTSQHPSKPVLAQLVLHARRAADYLAQSIMNGANVLSETETAARLLFHTAHVACDVRMRLSPELHSGKRKRSTVNARAWGVMPKQALRAGTLYARSQVRPVTSNAPFETMIFACERPTGRATIQTVSAGSLVTQLLIGVDPPATLLRTLEATLGDTALVFHDALGEEQVGERGRGSPCRTLGLVLRPAAFVPRSRVQLGTAHLAMPLAAPTASHNISSPLLVSAVEMIRHLATHGKGLLLELQMVADGNQALAMLGR
jgi:hypothetical protein